MPKRNRHKELKRSGQFVVERAPTKAEQDVKLFAESVRSQEAAERKAQQQAVEALRRANRHDELTAAKAAAVADLKAARARGGTDRIAAAEATYRTALADLQEFETGERPAWAPPPPADDASESQASAVEGSPEGAQAVAEDEAAAD
jgi:hypothetical protein